MTSKFYYDPARPSAFSTLEKLQAAVRKTKPTDDIRAWLEKQDAYTLHRQVKKRFPRNPYSVNNVMDVSECDLVDVQAFGKFNENYRVEVKTFTFSSGSQSLSIDNVVLRPIPKRLLFTMLKNTDFLGSINTNP